MTIQLAPDPRLDAIRKHVESDLELDHKILEGMEELRRRDAH